jgi:hypothetical protein
MAEENPPQNSPTAPIPFNIGEEFSSPSKKLPPARIVAACIVVIGVVIAIYAFVKRPHSFSSGSIDTITSVEVPGQNSVLLAMNITIQNNGSIPYVIHDVQASLDTVNGHFADQVVSAADFARYYQALPDLKKAPLDPIKPEDRIAPGGVERGTIMVLFPVTQDAFAARKSLQVTINPYDQPVPLILTK